MDYTKFEVDHSLINSNFLCYKLNSDKLLKKSIYLKNRPIQVDQNYNFFSKQHLQQFADGTNRFFYFKKNFGKENVFCYFDANLNIIEITQTAEGVFTETEYFTDLKDFKSNPEYYPYIELVSNNSDNYIVALGETLFYLSREKNEKRFKALSCCKFEESISVLCVKIHVEGLNCVSIFVCQVLHKSLFQEVPTGGSNYLTQIDHVLLQDSILTKMETIYSIHYPKFLSYSPKHDICLVVASSGVHFNIEDLLKEFPKSKDLINSNLNYTFSENLSQVKIDIKIENILYDSANVVISQNNLKVFVHYTTNIDSLSGCLFENVDCDGSNWSVKDNYINIILKKTHEKMWKVLFKINFVRNKTPSESNEKSESLVEEKEKEVNCNVIEDTENLIEIGEVYQIHQVELKNKTKKIVNQLELSDLVNTRQGIFGGLETNLNAIEADTLFLCKNVDLAAFRLYIDEKLIKTTNVSVNVIKARHVYSLDALSYIQSGKKNSTIYQSYSPNCKFSVIVEKCNNVYIYLKESSQLNKKTIHKNPKIVDTIAKQYIFTLADKFDDIVGIKIINDHQIHLLTQLSIIVLYIKI